MLSCNNFCGAAVAAMSFVAVCVAACHGVVCGAYMTGSSSSSKRLVQMWSFVTGDTVHLSRQLWHSSARLGACMLRYGCLQCHMLCTALFLVCCHMQAGQHGRRQRQQRRQPAARTAGQQQQQLGCSSRQQHTRRQQQRPASRLNNRLSGSSCSSSAAQSGPHQLYSCRSTACIQEAPAGPAAPAE